MKWEKRASVARFSSLNVKFLRTFAVREPFNLSAKSSLEEVMKKIGLIVFAVCIVVGLAFANFFSFGRITNRLFNFKVDIGNNVRGSGNVGSEKRGVSGFTSVDVSGVFQVEIVAGKDYSVEVQADDNLLPLIETKTDGNVLRIDLSEKASTRNDMIVRITAPNIERVETTGAAKVTASGISNDSFAIDSTGASKVNLSGETAKLDIDITGASLVDAEQLKAVNVDIQASGASKINVNVSGTLHTEASGASRIVYSGDPKSVDNHQSGASSISKK